MLVGTWFVSPDVMGRYQPEAVTGEVTITDNEIDLTHGTADTTMTQGVFVVWTSGITAHVARNTILGCSRNSIEVLDNYLGTARETRSRD
jgi:hypothetical protein